MVQDESTGPGWRALYGALRLYNQGATFKGTGYYLSLFLVLAAGLIISTAMLRSNNFPRLHNKPAS